jgi:hypothetical protein
MRYWAYLNSKVLGPFEKEKLSGVPDFSLSSLICPESETGGQAVAWKEASTYPEVLAAFGAAPAPAQPGGPAAQSPLAMTMRGTLIEEPVIDMPAPVPAPAPAADSPLAMTMRGTLIEEAVIDAPAAQSPSPGVKPASGGIELTEKPPVADVREAAQPAPAAPTLEQVQAALISMAEMQSQLLGRLGRLESSVADLRVLVSQQLAKKD